MLLIELVLDPLDSTWGGMESEGLGAEDGEEGSRCSGGHCQGCTLTVFWVYLYFLHSSCFPTIHNNLLSRHLAIFAGLDVTNS